MAKSKLEKAIREFAGEWKRGTGDTYVAAAKDLVAHGYSEEEAAEFLESLYRAAAAEYGD